jgi:hypothetical protein
MLGQFRAQPQGLPQTGGDRISQPIIHFIFFICSDDKLFPEKPFLLYPPEFGRPYAVQKHRTLRGPGSFSLIGAYAELPAELANEVDKIVQKKLLGYRSRGEFVAEAVRDKLIQVKKA